MSPRLSCVTSGVRELPLRLSTSEVVQFSTHGIFVVIISNHIIYFPHTTFIYYKFIQIHCINIL